MKNKSLKKLFAWLTKPAKRTKKLTGNPGHRPILEQLSFDEKWAVTADGFTAHFVRYPRDPENYDQETLELLKKDHGLVQFQDDGTLLPKNDLPYPDMLYVLPNTPPSTEFHVNAKLLADALSGFTGDFDGRVKISIYKNTLTIQGYSSEDLELYALVMLMGDPQKKYWIPD